MTEAHIRPPIVRKRRWKSRDAGALLRDAARRAQTEGPQRLTLPGQTTTLLIVAEEPDHTMLNDRGPRSLLARLQSLGLSDLDLTREPDTGRDVAL